MAGSVLGRVCQRTRRRAGTGDLPERPVRAVDCDLHVFLLRFSPLPTRNLDPDDLKRDEDWQGNNAAFRSPECGKVYIVSAVTDRGVRSCPDCGRSSARASLKLGRRSGGTASIESVTAYRDSDVSLEAKDLYQTL